MFAIDRLEISVTYYPIGYIWDFNTGIVGYIDFKQRCEKIRIAIKINFLPLKQRVKRAVCLERMRTSFSKLLK